MQAVFLQFFKFLCYYICVSFLKRNPSVKRILFIEKNPEKAQQIADNLKKSLRFIKMDIHKEKHTEKSVWGLLIIYFLGFGGIL